ncbi:MAG: FAD-dependent oxidoreductase [Bryobacterales bacterium]|nr:FAD-dependent oxidoreductase [Bryobacterales bacterium]
MNRLGLAQRECARSAMRLGGCSVRVLYRRTRNEMPCLMEEVEGAEAEGVEFDFLASPVRLESTDGRRILLTCRRMKPGEPDASGRRIPAPVEGSDFSLECSTVIAATGQSVERTLAEREGLRVTTWGIAADERTLATNIPGVFAGGDALLGAGLAVRAVAAGRIAAASIRQYLSGEPVTGEPSQWGIAMQPVDE